MAETDPASVQKRLRALRRYEILDTPPEQAFDDLTRLATFICGTPMAAVVLLDARRQWFKASIGIAAKETPIEWSFCATTVQQSGVFQVRDTLEDPRFASNPLVTGEPKIRFYAGAPLVTPAGVPLGTICAADRVPRDLGAEQVEAMSALARQVIYMLELRGAGKALHAALAEKAATEEELRELQELLPMCAWCRRVRDDRSYWQHVDEYFATHSGIRFSHGVCPECAAKVLAGAGMPG